MGLFEQWALLLGYRPKIILFECISHCLGCDRRRNDIVDEISSLNCIIKLSSSDLAKNRLFIAWRELGRTATFIVFHLQIHLLLDPTNNSLPYTSFRLDLTHRISF